MIVFTIPLVSYFFSLSIYNLVIRGQCTNHASLIYTYLTLILICNAVRVITQVRVFDS
jgi:hypothetical protein